MEIKLNTAIYIILSDEQVKKLKSDYKAQKSNSEENKEIVLEINGVQKEFKFSDFGI